MGIRVQGSALDLSIARLGGEGGMQRGGRVPEYAGGEGGRGFAEHNRACLRGGGKRGGFGVHRGPRNTT